jgi:chitin synthase
MREHAWFEAESMLDLKAEPSPFNPVLMSPFDNSYAATPPPASNVGGLFPTENLSTPGSRENLLYAPGSVAMPQGTPARSIAPTSQNMTGDYGLGAKGDERRYDQEYYHDTGHAGKLDPEFGDPKRIEKKTIPLSRRVWVVFVWALTGWIPSFVLRFVGRMKRPDVRMAWREKVSLMFVIAFINCFIVFYIVFFGNLICPNKDKAWSTKEVGFHQGGDDFYVSIRGRVYDISKFWQIEHGDTDTRPTDALMLPLAGKNLDPYFPMPMTLACPGFQNLTDSYRLEFNSTDAIEIPQAVHTSGSQQPDPTTRLRDFDWYSERFLPRIKKYFKGDLVHSKKLIAEEARTKDRKWFIINEKVYDLTDYFHTARRMRNAPTHDFLPPAVTDLIKNNLGADISARWKTGDNHADWENSLNCLNNYFYVGKTDFREAGKCQFNSYILLAFTIILCTVILTKFLAALQLGSKRTPMAQDKFVVCMVPAYTEGEDQLRKGLDSLTALQYDNKRKLIFVVCDGMIVGGGNDRPTPKIVLDILGVDPKIDPPALPFRSATNSITERYIRVSMSTKATSSPTLSS